MTNPHRLNAFLSTGALPERTALDEAIARFAEAQDEIDFEKHDKRYHGGKFNPDTMTCGMREALENGDLADVITAERQEATDFDRKRREFNLQNAELKAQRRVQLDEAVLRKQRRLESEARRAKTDPVLRRVLYLRNADPKQLTDDEFNGWYGKCNDKGGKRVRNALNKMFVPYKQNCKGTVLGMVEGKRVYAHKRFAGEFSGSKNSQWLRNNDASGWQSKARMIRDFPKLLQTSKDSKVKDFTAHNDQHLAWMTVNGMQETTVQWEGKEWIAIFDCPSESELMLYDVIRRSENENG